MLCGAICLKHVHNSHGQTLSLTKSRKLCKTTRNGTYLADLMEALETLKYKNVRYRENVKWVELKRLVATKNDVFVVWWSDIYGGNTPAPADGHWSVVRGVTKDTIIIYDPDADQEITLSRDFFESRWWDWEVKDGERKDLIRTAVIAKWKGGK